MIPARKQLKPLWQTLSIMATVLIALAMAAGLMAVSITTTPVSGKSMVPTLSHEQLICTGTAHKPHKNDIIVVDMTPITGTKEHYIKRLIGTGGDQITFRVSGSTVTVSRNGQLLKETYIKEPMRLNSFSVPTADIAKAWSDELYRSGSVTVTVPEGEYFLMGDNRNNSSDSRSFGTVKASQLVSVALDISPIAGHTQTIITIGRLVAILVFIIFLFTGESMLFVGGKIYED